MKNNIPSSLADWDLELLRTLVQPGQVETSWFDFKGYLPDKESISKSCCAFANTDGGFVVIGVGEKPKKAGFKITGIDPCIDIGVDFGQRLKAEPAIFWDVKSLSVSDGKEVYIFHIPKSPSSPHAVTLEDHLRFYKRTNQGCEPMSRLEIKSQFVDNELVRQQIALMSLEIEECLHTLEFILRSPPSRELLLIGFDLDLVSRLTADLQPVLKAEPSIARNVVLLKRHIRMIDADKRFHLGRLTTNPNQDAQWYQSFQTEVSGTASAARQEAEAILSALKDLQV